jgi:hypothetical protein
MLFPARSLAFPWTAFSHPARPSVLVRGFSTVGGCIAITNVEGIRALPFYRELRCGPAAVSLRGAPRKRVKPRLTCNIRSRMEFATLRRPARPFSRICARFKLSWHWSGCLRPLARRRSVGLARSSVKVYWISVHKPMILRRVCDPSSRAGNQSYTARVTQGKEAVRE